MNNHTDAFHYKPFKRSVCSPTILEKLPEVGEMVEFEVIQENLTHANAPNLRRQRMVNGFGHTILDFIYEREFNLFFQDWTNINNKVAEKVTRHLTPKVIYCGLSILPIALCNFYKTRLCNFKKILTEVRR